MEKELLQDVIDKYLKRGFGSMNKHDFEVFIFNELLNTKYRGKSNYEISRDLKISESKVKSLYYEANLRYAVDLDESCQSAFIDAVQKIKLQKNIKDNEIRISFVVENLSVRKYLEHKLKNKGQFADFHFNTEVITVNATDFTELIEECAGERIKKTISRKITEDNMPSYREIIADFIEEKTKNLGDSASKGFSLQAEKLIDYITAKINK